ncbi:MAG: hypothetical protein K2Q22_03570, partial [Cytophagales bacterium]|nr:hypothetical protein [Cytophagales bacterium]
MKKIAITGIISLIAFLVSGQTQIGLTEQFGSSSTGSLGIFTTSTTNWTTSNTSPRSSTYSNPIAASGGFHARLGSGNKNLTFLTLSNSISTVNKTNITLYFSEWITSPFTVSNIQLDYSINNGATWTTSTFSSSATTSSNTTLRSFTLPTVCENVSQLKIRFSVKNSYSSSGFYRIDDFAIFGTVVPATYYNISGLPLDDINSWGVNTDGSGAHPYNFVTDGQTFN